MFTLSEQCFKQTIWCKGPFLILLFNSIQSYREQASLSASLSGLSSTTLE